MLFCLYNSASICAWLLRRHSFCTWNVFLFENIDCLFFFHSKVEEFRHAWSLTLIKLYSVSVKWSHCTWLWLTRREANLIASDGESVLWGINNNNKRLSLISGEWSQCPTLVGRQTSLSGTLESWCKNQPQTEEVRCLNGVRLDNYVVFSSELLRLHFRSI